MLILYGILAAALVTDFHSGRIPNFLILVGIGSGILYRAQGSEHWLLILLDGVITLIFLYPLYLWGAFGGGDIKLLIVIALFLGLETTANVGITALMAGAICSAAKILITYLKQKKICLSRLYIHFSFPILIGTIISSQGGFTWIRF